MSGDMSGIPAEEWRGLGYERRGVREAGVEGTAARYLFKF